MTTPEGNRALLAWLEAFGPIAVIGVESTGSFAAGLVRYLRSREVTVVEVNQPHAHTRRRRGKSDPIDAEMAARHALAGHATVVPKRTDGIVEAVRQLRLARDSAVKARTAAFNQLTEMIVTVPDELREHLTARKTTRGKTTLCSRLRPDLARLHEPAQAAKLALRSLARRVAELDQEIAALDEQLAPLVARAAPRTTQLLASPPATPASCSSPPARTSSASTATARSRRSAGPARSPCPPAAAAAFASTTAATATPTAPCT